MGRDGVKWGWLLTVRQDNDDDDDGDDGFVSILKKRTKKAATAMPVPIASAEAMVVRCISFVRACVVDEGRRECGLDDIGGCELSE